MKVNKKTAENTQTSLKRSFGKVLGKISDLDGSSSRVQPGEFHYKRQLQTSSASNQQASRPGYPSGLSWYLQKYTQRTNKLPEILPLETEFRAMCGFRKSLLKPSRKELRWKFKSLIIVFSVSFYQRHLTANQSFCKARDTITELSPEWIQFYSRGDI